MTRDEFLKTRFSSKTKVEYYGELYRIISIDFDDCCLLLDNNTMQGLSVTLKYIDSFKDAQDEH